MIEFNKLKNWLIAHSFKLSILLILGGFVVLSIGNNNNNGGNSFHQLILAPVLLILGYSLVIFAIMNRRKD